ncbi:MAG: ATP-binding protein, partial [Bacteroidota bacterium]
KNTITQLELNNAKNIRNFLIIGALLSLGLLLLSLWANSSLRKKNKTLEEKNREILLAQLTGQNIERKRMAGELHDNLNTKIAAIRWQLEAIGDLEATQDPILKNAINQLNDVYEDVRLISHNLMPETVQNIGLLNSIDDLILKLNKTDRVKFHFIKEEIQNKNLESLAYPIYNIIFEMVNNILKHSQADNAWISLSENEENDLTISISDDGVGFDVDQAKNGYGLKSIISRVEHLHGDYSIESAPGKGTKVFIEIPKL